MTGEEFLNTIASNKFERHYKYTTIDHLGFAYIWKHKPRYSKKDYTWKPGRKEYIQYDECVCIGVIRDWYNVNCEDYICKLD